MGKFFHIGYPLLYFIYNALEMCFPKFTGMYSVHSAAPLLKSNFEELWACEGEYFESLAGNRFRSDSDVNQYLFREWGKLKGRFYPSNVTRHVMYSEISDDNGRVISFINGFVTASLTVGIGAMGIMGSINDGIYGDYAILAAKATIDFVIILVMASSMGKGCAFSSITVLVTQGSITALAAAFGGMLTDAMLTNISMTGGILIFCIGINLVWENTIKVANLLPALVVTCIIALI